MPVACVILGLLILLIVLVDTFETIIVPRSVSRPLRLANLLTAIMWRAWRAIGRKLGRRREAWLGGFGPLSLVMLIVCWAGLLTLGFALIQEGLGTKLSGDPLPNFWVHLYMSATTLFTLGYGDMTALDGMGRAVSVVEAGVGFGFLAVVIGYLPVLYQSFSRREATILIMDSRAGAPPSACELLTRSGDDLDSLTDLLAEFERWSASLLESYLSYPILAYYRSQHDKLTWLGTITTVLDACSIVSLGFRGDLADRRRLERQVEHTYAIARHLIVDLAYIVGAPPMQPSSDRIPPEVLDQVHQRLDAVGLPLHRGGDVHKRLAIRRREYEPYVEGLANHLLVAIPPVLHDPDTRDSWQTSAWDDGTHF